MWATLLFKECRLLKLNYLINTNITVTIEITEAGITNAVKLHVSGYKYCINREFHLTLFLFIVEHKNVFGYEWNKHQMLIQSRFNRFSFKFS